MSHDLAMQVMVWSPPCQIDAGTPGVGRSNGQQPSTKQTACYATVAQLFLHIADDLSEVQQTCCSRSPALMFCSQWRVEELHPASGQLQDQGTYLSRRHGSCVHELHLSSIIPTSVEDSSSISCGISNAQTTRSAREVECVVCYSY